MNRVILTGNETYDEVDQILRAPKESTYLLTKAALSRLLERYARGELDRQQIFEMCDVLQWLENVEYEEVYGDVIADVLFRMATPRHPDGTDWIDIPRMRAELQQAKPA